MSFMDKFRKKDDDLGLDDNPIGAPPEGGDPFGGQQSQNPMSNPSQQPDQFGNPNPTGQPDQFGNPDLNNVKNLARPKDPVEQSGFNNPTVMQQQPTTTNSEHIEKDLQLIIAKLDGLKSEIDSLHQRVQKIEKIAESDQAAAQQRQQQRYRW